MIEATHNLSKNNENQIFEQHTYNNCKVCHISLYPKFYKLFFLHP